MNRLFAVDAALIDDVGAERVCLAFPTRCIFVSASAVYERGKDVREVNIYVIADLE